MQSPDSTQLFSRTTWLRGLAISGVLLIHATAPVIDPRYQISLPWIAVLTAINQAARYSVPLFFFLSGLIYGFLYADRPINYPAFLYKRAIKILIPYTFWVCFYLFIRSATGDIQVAALTGKHLLFLYSTGGAAGHLYFIPAIFQFYLLLPFLLIIANSSSLAFRVLILVLMLALLQFRMTAGQIQPVASILCRSYWFYWWAPFSLLGLRCGIQIKQKQPLKLASWLISGLAAIFFLFLWYEYVSAYLGAIPYYRQVLAGDFSRIATFLRPSAFVYALACCLLCCRLIEKKHLPGRRFFESLGIYSFGIYLAHPFVNKCLLKTCKIIGMEPTGTLWSVALLFFGGSTLTYLLVRWCGHISACRYILGPLH